jgi:hypothetical protein
VSLAVPGIQGEYEFGAMTRDRLQSALEEECLEQGSYKS